MTWRSRPRSLWLQASCTAAWIAWKALRSASSTFVSVPRIAGAFGAAAAPTEAGSGPTVHAAPGPPPADAGAAAGEEPDRQEDQAADQQHHQQAAEHAAHAGAHAEMAEQRRAEEAAGQPGQERVALEEARLGAAPAAPAAPAPAGLAAWVALGFMLRVIGAASFCSKVRDPRLPMPEEPDDAPLLEEDLPARASARLGASARVSARNSARKAGQSRFGAGRAGSSDRLDMAMSVREPMKLSAR